MENITQPLDTLYFVPAKKKFLKIQPGTGDNLLREDRALGYCDYFLYSVFSPDDLGLDDELDMNCEDSGMILLKEMCYDTDEIVADCVKMAFDEEFETIKLMTNEDL
ncbi:MAG: hypothetical protein IKS96_11950 [Fibrobacter sp.]|nr:hypothetical protein [Fibrobacter sp.]